LVRILRNIAIKTNNTGIIFDIQRFSLHDGPGIRTNIYFKGCPLRCSWCSNPESQSKKMGYFIFSERCDPACTKCIDVCKENALLKRNNTPVLKSIKCTCCDRCMNVCPNGAIKKVGKLYNISEIAELVLKDIKIFKRSGGGVTFTGGEPTAQPEFLNSLVRSMTDLKIDTCIETCGYFVYEKCIKTLCSIDTILYDLKIVDNELSRKYIEADSNLIIENLARLSGDYGGKLIVRIPLIPGITTTTENLHSINILLERTQGKIKEIELLPYHKLGLKKYKLLGRQYELKHLQLLGQAEINKIMEIFKGFKVRIVV
jgi:pyruvate formate lyase activating enzyme